MIGLIVFASTVASTVSAMTAKSAFSMTHTEAWQKFHPFNELPAFSWDARNNEGVLRCLNTHCGRFSLRRVYATWKKARSQLGYRYHDDWLIPLCPFCHPDQDEATYGHLWSDSYAWDAQLPPGFPLAPPQPYQQVILAGPPGPAKAKATQHPPPPPPKAKANGAAPTVVLASTDDVMIQRSEDLLEMVRALDLRVVALEGRCQRMEDLLEMVRALELRVNALEENAPPSNGSMEVSPTEQNP